MLTTANLRKGKQSPVLGYSADQGTDARLLVSGVGAMNTSGAEVAIGFTEYYTLVHANAVPVSTDTGFHQVGIYLGSPGKPKPGDLGGDCHAFSTGTGSGTCTNTTVVDCKDAPPFP